MSGCTSLLSHVAAAIGRLDIEADSRRLAASHLFATQHVTPHRTRHMPNPARAGALIYALDLERLAGFYATLLSMRRDHGDAEHVVLSNDDFQLIVHVIPAECATGIIVATLPEPRESTPIKLFFIVDSLDHAANEAARLGGMLFPQAWTGPNFVVRNGCDPEGNIFQLREITGEMSA